MPHYIYRIETGYTRGWQVRVPEKPSKLFSDRLHGSKEEAREQAKRYRDGLTKTLPTTPYAHLHTEETRRKAQQSLSSTGIEGFSITFAFAADDALIPYAQMFYRDGEGRTRSRKRSLRLAGVRRGVKEICEMIVELRPDYNNLDALYERALEVTLEILEEEGVDAEEEGLL